MNLLTRFGAKSRIDLLTQGQIMNILKICSIFKLLAAQGVVAGFVPPKKDMFDLLKTFVRSVSLNIIKNHLFTA